MCGTDAFVHLFFHPNQPMFFNAGKATKDLIVIEIPIDALEWSLTLFSNQNAGSSRVLIGPDMVDLARVDFDLFQRGYWQDDFERQKWQAEVLVHNSVPWSPLFKLHSFMDICARHDANVPREVRRNYLEQQLRKQAVFE